MDTFFSLFDPSEDQGKSNKSKCTDDEPQKGKTDAPKGRRRGRRSSSKNESLPEESSFLCAPELSNELCKENSYFDCFFQTPEEDAKPDTDKKPKRRNSTRKNRRKKSKVSPFKDLSPAPSWIQEDQSELNLNNRNQSLKPRNAADVGKNVNNLSGGLDTLDMFDYVKKSRRKTEPFSDDQVYKGEVVPVEDRPINTVLDKLEILKLSGDEYCSDFGPDDLVDDDDTGSEDACDDDDDDEIDESGSDMDESCESYGRLPPEPRFGNVEYKLQLVNVTEKRFQHLVTQLKWRLVSGGGAALYVVGVRDCGRVSGLCARALRRSVRVVRRMARALRALVAVRAVRVPAPGRHAPPRYVAELWIRKLAETPQSVELRIAVMGANDAGKSTLIGVLTQGELDNGRGSARLNMFRHVHEVRSGRTSSLSHEILGFDQQGNVVNYGCSQLMTAERIGERSSKLVSFLDLAGHSKYQHTTIRGLTGYSPHYAVVVVSACAGITPITEEHISLLIALELPFFIVINKCELQSDKNYDSILQELTNILKGNMKPLLITDEVMATKCSQSRCESSGTRHDDDKNGNVDGKESESIAVFPVSCVTGQGLNSLHAYLLALHVPTEPTPAVEEECCEFQIDEIFHVCDTAGPVVGGLLAAGRLHEGDDLLIGPLDNGEFVGISVKTIYRNRVPCHSVRAGQSASLGLSRVPPRLRQGMVLLSPPREPRGPRHPRVFGGCPPGQCARAIQPTNNQEKYNKRGIPSPPTNNEEKNNKWGIPSPPTNNEEKNNKWGIPSPPTNNEEKYNKRGIPLPTNNQEKYTSKNTRRKRLNLMKDLEMVQRSLAKVSCDVEGNIYKSSDESDVEKADGQCCCGDAVYLEDPDDPRGCLYFQASIQLLRHSTPYIAPGFQCTVHVGNVRQTAVIVGIMTSSGVLERGSEASAVFRFSRAEYLRTGRRVLCRAGAATAAIGLIQQIFPLKQMT